jgi:hypothetical protein
VDEQDIGKVEAAPWEPVIVDAWPAGHGERTDATGIVAML